MIVLINFTTRCLNKKHFPTKIIPPAHLPPDHPGILPSLYHPPNFLGVLPLERIMFFSITGLILDWNDFPIKRNGFTIMIQISDALR
jgi:hypothetical protein